MAKSTQERSAKAADKREKVGEEDLRLRVRPGTKQALIELMAWNGITEMGEAMTLMIHHLHAMGPGKSAPMLEIPRHAIDISPNVARDFHNKSLIAISKDPGDEIIEPRLLPHGPDECAKAQLDILSQ